MTMTVAFDAGTSGSKVIAHYQAEEYPFDRVEKYFLVDPSVQPLTQQTYKDLLDYAADGTGLGSNLVRVYRPKKRL